MLLEHFRSKHLVVTKTYSFDDIQQEGDSVSNSFVCLKNLLSTCKSGTFLKRALRNKFVYGLNYENIQRKLLSKDMSFRNAFKVTLARDLAAIDGRTLSLSGPNTFCGQIILVELVLPFSLHNG